MQKGNQNKLIYSILIAICIIGFWWFENFYTPASYSVPEGGPSALEISKELIPATKNGEFVAHQNYVLSYLESYEQAQYVMYRLDASHLTYEDRERPFFIEDPKVRTKSADWRNYRGSGYDRGHLCPAGDRRFSENAYKETFYTSNISPQDKDFNAGIWNKLEQQARRWAKRYKTVYIATGGVLEPGLDKIGEEDVAVPEYFYKVIFRGEGKDLSAIAFLIPHQETDRPLREFIVSVDEVERITGIDFFPGIQDDMEERLENGRPYGKWKF